VSKKSECIESREERIIALEITLRRMVEMTNPLMEHDTDELHRLRVHAQSLLNENPDCRELIE